MREDYIYLRHIVEAIDQIEDYLTGTDYTIFTQSKLIQDAVVRQLSVIGEIAKMVSSDIRENYTEVKWVDLDKMYESLLKNFLKLDTEMIWRTAKNDMPHLRQVIEDIIY